MIKRICLFLFMNFLIILTISVILSLLNVKPYLNQYNLDYRSLAIFCGIWGFVGALISLAFSRIMAKKLLGVKMISYTHPENETETMLLQMVEKLAQRANLPDIPSVGIFHSLQPNAFATGPTKRRSLVAVSSGLISNLSQEELEAVIGHEISHIASGDMVTMTLLQGVVNAFVMFLARVLAFALSSSSRSRNKNSSYSYAGFHMFTFIFEIVFMLLGSLVISYVSRAREFRADAGSARLLGKKPMISALKTLDLLSSKGLPKESESSSSIAALMIFRPSKKMGLLKLFATHPPIEERIKALENWEMCLI